MRLKTEIKDFIKETAAVLFPEAKLYLFGSRLDNKARGGDIDILILTEQKVPKKKLRRFRLQFYKKFGWQKIDIVNFTIDDTAAFKELILTNAQAL